MPKITNRTVDAAKPGEFLWDQELKGFGLKATVTGKVYILQFRMGGRGTTTKRITIGRHGALTPAQARKEAARLLGAIASGTDPTVLRAAAKEAPAVADMAKRFLAEHVATKTKASTAVEYRRMVETVIVPAIGRKRARDVTRTDISRLHHAHRDTPYAANRLLAVLSKMFALADLGNPCRGVQRYAEHKRERMLSGDEFTRLAAALKTSRALYAVAAIKLLIFTGARLSEILTLKWDWIDFDRGEARLPDSKTGAKTLHLPAPALAVLETLPRIAGNPHVIVGHVTGAHMVNMQKPWRAIRKAAGLDGLRIHDLRHAFASVAASSGMGLPIIGKMLGHAQASTTHRYAHLQADPVKAAAEAVAGKIASAMEP